MKKLVSGIFLFFLVPISLFAQSELSVYATMDAADALSFKALYPEGIEILSSTDSQAAVFLSEEATHLIHENVLTHGPGYVFRSSEKRAMEALEPVAKRTTNIQFTITEDVLVNQCLDMVDPINIENDILELEAYGTRYHTMAQAVQAVMNQKAKWDAMIALSGRTDVHTRLYSHVNTPMPSVILTMDGADRPDEFVIVGGHIDSTSWNNVNAPGADDNASGIASLNEMVRVLLEKGFVPSRTIEVMAFAAEEIGLVGSDEIANEYFNDNVNVIAYVQFDMTAYNGSSDDIFITTDSYNSNDLNTFLVDLMDHYNGSGNHTFTYGYTACGYACSDHASWAQYGYRAAFPFEAAMGHDNPNIHTPNDVYSFFNTPDHSVKFTKLGLEFLIETAKSKSLGIEDHSAGSVDIFVDGKILNYDLGNLSSPIKEIALYNVSGQRIYNKTGNNGKGILDLNHLVDGFYIVQFTLENTHVISIKIILN